MGLTTLDQLQREHAIVRYRWAIVAYCNDEVPIPVLIGRVGFDSSIRLIPVDLRGMRLLHQDEIRDQLLSVELPDKMAFLFLARDPEEVALRLRASSAEIEL